MSIDSIRDVLDTPGGMELLGKFKDLEKRYLDDVLSRTAVVGIGLEEVKYSRGVLTGIQLCINVLKESVKDETQDS